MTRYRDDRNQNRDWNDRQGRDDREMFDQGRPRDDRSGMGRSFMSDDMQRGQWDDRSMGRSDVGRGDRGRMGGGGDRSMDRGAEGGWSSPGPGYGMASDGPYETSGRGPSWDDRSGRGRQGWGSGMGQGQSWGGMGQSGMGRGDSEWGGMRHSGQDGQGSGMGQMGQGAGSLGYGAQGYGGQSYGSQGYGGQWNGQGMGGQPGGSRESYRGRGPSGYRRSDERIQEQVNEALEDDDRVDAEHISVQVQGGEVTLTGTVRDRYQKRCAEDCVEAVRGVKDVHNQLRVQSGQGMSGEMPGQAGRQSGTGGVSLGSTGGSEMGSTTSTTSGTGGSSVTGAQSTTGRTGNS